MNERGIAVIRNTIASSFRTSVHKSKSMFEARMASSLAYNLFRS